MSLPGGGASACVAALSVLGLLRVLRADTSISLTVPVPVWLAGPFFALGLRGGVHGLLHILRADTGISLTAALLAPAVLSCSKPQSSATCFSLIAVAAVVACDALP